MLFPFDIKFLKGKNTVFPPYLEPHKLQKMRLFFSIHYYTQWGQYVGIHIRNINHYLLLTHERDGVWSGSIDLIDENLNLAYAYFIYDETDQSRSYEWGKFRTLSIETGRTSIRLVDQWKPKGHEKNPFYSSAFMDVIFKQEANNIDLNPYMPCLKLKVMEVQIPSDCCLCISGNLDSLGNWNSETPVLLNNAQFPVWETNIPILNPEIPVLFKFGIFSHSEKKIIAIENHSVRTIQYDEKFAINQFSFQHLNFGYQWKGAGVAVPVFSLRSTQGLGVGEFNDLIALIDFAVQSGFKMVQILPINDTSATFSNADSYPYAAISVFALHPIYLNLEKTGIHSSLLNPLKQALNLHPFVDYQEVIALKNKLTRSYFEENFDAITQDDTLKNFVEINAQWIYDYAAFCSLRDYYSTVNFNNWEKESIHSRPRIDQMATMGDGIHYRNIWYYFFLQHQVHIQLKEVTDYARSNGIVLKGDLPIGIYRYSVDAWVFPDLFNMDGQAGAPPDPFSETGQNWGFPSYNWDEMEKDGYAWWKNRFSQLSQYFDAFRIDHILGFFRIWEIPLQQVDGLLGRFNPAIPLQIIDFQKAGIHFDYHRFCQPYIDKNWLISLFGTAAPEIEKVFLKDDLQLKLAFSTQRQIEEFVHKRPEYHPFLKKLYSLVSNVLFIPDPVEGYHPRIDMMKTYSFQQLKPTDQEKLLRLYYDYFYNKQEKFWETQGLKKLPAIKNATDMLICGEDLGMVPACVPNVMKQLDMLSLEIQRMSKNPSTLFLNENDIPYHSVMSPSTHDMSPLRLWWQESDKPYLLQFYRDELKFNANEVPDFQSFIAERMIGIQADWKGMWAVFPLQDLMAMDVKLWRENPEDERINIPSDPNHFWKFRFHLSLEDLLMNNIFQNKIKGILRLSGR
jgi:4-alpha-glucanotransferase